MSERGVNGRHSRVSPSPGRGSKVAYSPCPRSDPQEIEMAGNCLAIPMSAIQTNGNSKDEQKRWHENRQLNRTTARFIQKNSIMPAQWLVIGISGITCSGKTSLALSLRDFFVNRRCARLGNSKYVKSDVQLISQDDYFLPVDDLHHKWVEKLNAINFEVLTSLDMKQMLFDITWTMKGRYLAMDNNSATQTQTATNIASTTPPDYLGELKTFENAQNTTKLNILIIEGFLIFNQPELLQLCQLKLHFHLPYEKCFARQKLRTYDPPDVTGYFEMCVWPYYEKNFAEFRERKDLLVLNGDLCKEKMFKFVVQRINVYLSEMMTSPCLMDQ